MTLPAVKLINVERDGRILTVRFDRGDASNALSRALMRELLDLAVGLEDDHELSAIVLTGAPKVFSMGFDLKDPSSADLATASFSELRKVGSLGPRLCRAWAALEPLTIAAIEGWCVGGGVALAISCDLRVCGISSMFYVPEIERGMNMSWQSVPRMVSTIGPSKTKRLFVLAEKIDAETAKDWGLVDEIVPDGGAFERAMDFAQQAAKLPPVGVRITNEAVKVAANALTHAVSFADRDQFMLTQTSDDYQEGVNSFLEKRPPKFKG